MWEGWTRKTRKTLQNVKFNLRRERTRQLRKAGDLVSFAEAESTSTPSIEARLQLERAEDVLSFQKR